MSSILQQTSSNKRGAYDDAIQNRPPTKKARTRAKSYASSKIITLVANSGGSVKGSFHVHENLLLNESKNIADLIFTNDGKDLLLDTPLDALEVLVEYFYNNDFAASAAWEPTITLEYFIHAWVLADELGMEDAKNAIMDRLRMTVDMAYTHELEGTSDATLVLEAVATMQAMVDKPKRWCPLYTFLIHRLARDLSKGSEALVMQSSPELEPTFQAVLSKGGDVAVDIVTRCFAVKRANELGPQPDPAALKGCHFHDHTPGRESRVYSEAEQKDKMDDMASASAVKTEALAHTVSISFPSIATTSAPKFGASLSNISNGSAPGQQGGGFSSDPQAGSSFAGFRGATFDQVTVPGSGSRAPIFSGDSVATNTWNGAGIFEFGNRQ